MSDPGKSVTSGGGQSAWRAQIPEALKNKVPAGANGITQDGDVYIFTKDGKAIEGGKYNADGSVFTASATGTSGTGRTGGTTGTGTTATGDLSTLLAGNGSSTVGGDFTSNWTNGSFKIDENMFSAASNGMFAGILSTMFGGTNMVNWMQNVYNGFLNSLSFNFNTSSTSTSTRTDTDNEGATVDGGSKTSSNTSGQKPVSDFPSGGKITKPEGAEKYEVKDGITTFYDKDGKVIGRYNSAGAELETEETEAPTGNNPTGSKPTSTTTPPKKKAPAKTKTSSDPRPVMYTYDEFLEHNRKKGCTLNEKDLSGGGKQVTSGDGSVAQFNAKGQMTQWKNGGKTYTYTYNGDDNHVVSTTEVDNKTYLTKTRNGNASMDGFNYTMKTFKEKFKNEAVNGEFKTSGNTVSYTKKEKASVSIFETRTHAGTKKYTYNDITVTVTATFTDDGKSIKSISEKWDTKSANDRARAAADYAEKQAKEKADEAARRAKNQEGNDRYFSSEAQYGCVPGNK